MRWRKLLLAAAASTAALLGTSANATTVADIDVNNFTASHTGTLSGATYSTYTGTFTLSKDSDTIVSGFDSSANSDVWTFNTAAVLSTFSATMHFSAGVLTGGTFTIALTNGDSYTGSFYDNRGGVGNIAYDPSDPNGNFYSVKAGTKDGLFTDGNGDSKFGSVGISEFLLSPDNGSLFGDIFQFDYSGMSGDDDVDAEFTVVVPVPPAVGLGLAGLLGVAVLRRRRNKVA